MWITRLKLVKITTEHPQAVARIQTDRGGRKRSVPIQIARDPDTGYRWIDTDSLKARLTGVTTRQNETDEPVKRGE